mgnify:CR=1 FL=1
MSNKINNAEMFFSSKNNSSNQLNQSNQSNTNLSITSTFIHKYKPRNLDGFFASNKFKSVLRTLLQMDDLNIIFIGNPCSGKTILLQTLIREYYGLINQEPLPEHNILYINNLKEQGVGYFRSELKTFCQSHSLIRGKKKMVVIDDIDTMNEQSQLMRFLKRKITHVCTFIKLFVSKMDKFCFSFISITPETIS